MTAPVLSDLNERVARFEEEHSVHRSWCGLHCDAGNYEVAAVCHTSRDFLTASKPDLLTDPEGVVKVWAWRYEALDRATEQGVDINFSRANWIRSAGIGTFTAEQAIALGQALIAAGQLILSEENR